MNNQKQGQKKATLPDDIVVVWRDTEMKLASAQKLRTAFRQAVVRIKPLQASAKRFGVRALVEHWEQQSGHFTREAADLQEAIDVALSPQVVPVTVEDCGDAKVADPDKMYARQAQSDTVEASSDE